MTQLGAEVDALDGLATTFAAEGRRLEAVASALQGALAGVVWLGDDAVAFRTRWRSTMAPGVRTIAAAMHEQARRLGEQARQQRAASEDQPGVNGFGGPPVPWPGWPPLEQPDPPPLPPGWPSPPPEWPVPPDWPIPPDDGPRVPPDWPVPPEDGPRVPPDWPVPPVPPERTLPPDRVVRSEVVHGNGTVGIGPAQIRVDGTYKIEYLANGQVRVTELVAAQAGAGLSVEAWGEVDGGDAEHRLGGNAGITGTAGLQAGRTWEVPAGDVDRLIVGIALDRADPTGLGREGAGRGADVLDRLTPDRWTPFDEANRAADRYLTYDVPEPTRKSLDLVQSGEALAMLGISMEPSGEASLRGDVAVGGFRESDGDLGVRFSQSGSVNGELDLPALRSLGLPDPPSGSAQLSQSVEVLHGPDGVPKQITMEQVSGTGSHQTVQTVTLDLDSAQLRADAVAVRDFVVDPSPANAARVAHIDPARWAAGKQYVEATTKVDATDYGVGAGSGFDPIDGSVKISVDTQSTTYDYGR